MTDKITSYHAHIYFSRGPEAEQAMALRERIERELAGRVVVGRFHDKPVGPHPRGSFQLEVSLEESTAVLKWLMENRDGLSVFFHGNSGNHYLDHTAHVAWLGESEILTLSIFE